MKRHHSPNFLTNLEETEAAEYSYVNSGLTILALLLIAVFAASCSKSVDAPTLRTPNRSNVIAQTITVDVRVYPFNGYWIIEVIHPALVTVETTLVLSYGTFTTPVGFRQTARNVGSVQPIDIRLIEAKGQKNTLYILNFVR